jgi:uncharacterized membrane protein
VSVFADYKNQDLADSIAYLWELRKASAKALDHAALALSASELTMLRQLLREADQRGFPVPRREDIDRWMSRS